jgi:ATP synthase protein I
MKSIIFGCLRGLVAVSKSGYSVVRKILILQALFIGVVTLGFAVLGGMNDGISSVLGGLTAFIPNLYFAYRISLVKGYSAKKIVHAFYGGESLKILMTCAFFALAYQVPDVQFVPLMTCFVAVISVFWLALILFAQEVEI